MRGGHIKEIIQFIITHKHNLSDDVLTQMISCYKINDEMFHKIVAKSSYQKTITNKIDNNKLIKTRTNIKLHHNSLTIKMLSIKNNGTTAANIDNDTINKIKDYLGLNKMADMDELLKRIDEFLIYL